jgi:hypothetical protein
MDLLNRKNALRSLLRNPAYHNQDTSVPSDLITPEAEPELFAAIRRFVTYILTHPNVLLTDTYPLEERQHDWKRLCECDTVVLDSRSRPGHKLLDHHMPHFWHVKNWKGISVASLMTEANLEKAIRLNVSMHSTPYKSEIRRSLVLSGGLSNVTKYRAGLSKHIVKKFGATRVLDPCIGWGGRMIGSLAAGAEYTGFEPDPQTFVGLCGILKDIERPADISQVPAEVGLPRLKTSSYDLVLTSPPYYNLELYTAGDQSTNHYSDWDTWTRDWLRVVIHECIRCLRPDGKSCWSVKNFKSDKKYPLADTVFAFHEELGWTCIDRISLNGPGRPGAQKPAEEETFVFARVIE